MRSLPSYLSYQDPRTKTIPLGLRQKELEFVRALPRRELFQGEGSRALRFNWVELKPSQTTRQPISMEIDNSFGPHADSAHPELSTLPQREICRLLARRDLANGYHLTALTHSGSTLDFIYAGISGEDLPPKLFRIGQDESMELTVVEVSIPSSPPGAWISDIAVNPEANDEILVAYSNYGIVGLYHSTDAGSSFSPVEGNLQGTAEQPGPSLRSATILPLRQPAKRTRNPLLVSASQPKQTPLLYVVGTSSGLVATSTLCGPSTRWYRVAVKELGTSVIERIFSWPLHQLILVRLSGGQDFLGELSSPDRDFADQSAPSRALGVWDNSGHAAGFRLSSSFPFSLPACL